MTGARSIAERPGRQPLVRHADGGEPLAGRAIFTSLGTAQGLPPGHVRTACYVDREGTLWAGHPGGAGALERRALRALHPPARAAWRRRSPCCASGAAGGFWVGTAGGGLAYFIHGPARVLVAAEGQPMFSRAAGAPRGAQRHALDRHRRGALPLEERDASPRFSREEGLFDDRIFQILPDEQGHLWMSCNKGIFRVAQAELEAVAEGQLERVTSRVYGAEDGMRSEECNGMGSPAGMRGAGRPAVVPHHPGRRRLRSGQPEEHAHAVAPAGAHRGAAGGRARRARRRVEPSIPVGEGQRGDPLHLPEPAGPAAAALPLPARGRRRGLGAGRAAGAWPTTRSCRRGTTGSGWGRSPRTAERAAPEATLAFYLEPRFHQTLAFRVACVLTVVLAGGGRGVAARAPAAPARARAAGPRGRAHRRAGHRQRRPAGPAPGAAGHARAARPRREDGGGGHAGRGRGARDQQPAGLHHLQPPLRGHGGARGRGAGRGARALGGGGAGARRGAAGRGPGAPHRPGSAGRSRGMQPEQLQRVDLHAVLDLALSIADGGAAPPRPGGEGLRRAASRCSETRRGWARCSSTCWSTPPRPSPRATRTRTRSASPRARTSGATPWWR